jgi:hypothetical protein
LFELGCVEKGCSYNEGGPIYNVISPHIGGVADTVNSLFAIKKLVFDDKKITLDGLLKTLRNDWRGAEDLRQYALNRYEYYGNDSRLNSYPRVTASFVTKIKREECKPKAEFTATFMVGKAGYELDKDGVETDKYKITGMIPQFGGKVDVVPFYAVNPGVIDAVSNYWNEGDTVRATGKLNFTSETKEVEVKVDFGDPVIDTRTFSISELVITGGSSTPLDGEFAINYDDVKAALEQRKTRLAELKDKASNKGTSGKAPAPASGNKFKDLGF